MVSIAIIGSGFGGLGAAIRLRQEGIDDFVVLGPNTGTGHTTVVILAEAQIEHLLSALHYMRKYGIDAIEPRAEVQAEFVARIDDRMRGTVWLAGGCASWYLDSTGRNATLWPDFTWRFTRRVSQFHPEEYVLGN